MSSGGHRDRAVATSRGRCHRSVSMTTGRHGLPSRTGQLRHPPHRPLTWLGEGSHQLAGFVAGLPCSTCLGASVFAVLPLVPLPPPMLPGSLPVVGPPPGEGWSGVPRNACSTVTTAA